MDADGDNAHLRLFYSSELQSVVDYCTLSRCWGKTPMTMLQKHNLALFQEKIPHLMLPQTFLHTIYTAHHLGFCYIWIDSSRIIQDDDSDWQREASMMSDVYAASSLNIAAPAASNGEIGCIVSRTSEHIKNIRPCVVQLSSPDLTGKIYACQNPWL